MSGCPFRFGTVTVRFALGVLVAGVVRGVQFGGFGGVVLGMGVVAMRQVGMMARGFVLAGLLVFGGLFVVIGGLLVVVGSLGVMVLDGIRHGDLRWQFCARPGWG